MAGCMAIGTTAMGPAANDSIADVLTSQASGFMDSILVAHMINNRQYSFKSRSQDLSNAFVRVIEENKGTLLFNKTVTRILTGENGVTGVRTEDGVTYPASVDNAFMNRIKNSTPVEGLYRSSG